MGAPTVIFYLECGRAPALEWLEALPNHAYAKALVRIERLGQLGHELRRPECDYLRDGVYELRWRLGSVNYRLLYFFHGREAVVLACGLTKESEVPHKDIERAIAAKAAFTADPEAHTYEEEGR